MRCCFVAILLLWATSAAAQAPRRATPVGTTEPVAAPAESRDAAEPPDGAVSGEREGALDDADPNETGPEDDAVPDATATTDTTAADAAQNPPVERERVLETVEDDSAGPAPRSLEDRRHIHTFALRFGIGFHYYFGIKYGDGPRCDSTDPAVEVDEFCHRMGEPFLDLELSYSVANNFAITVSTMLQLDADRIAGNAGRIFGIGVRGYTSEDAIVKGLFGARVILDWTQSDVDQWSDVDVGLRGEVGLQVDVIRWLAFYMTGGVIVRFLRGFTLLPEVQGGLQVRFP